MAVLTPTRPLRVRDADLETRRAICRKSVLGWAANCWGDRIKPYWHSKLIDERLVHLYSHDNDDNFLIVSQPPRTGKTMLTVLFGATKYLAENPDHSVFFVSHNQRAADKFGRQAKMIFQQYAPEIFDVELDPERKAHGHWGVKNHEGSFTSIGWGGPITGQKVHLLNIDDLIKDSKEALSINIRDDIWSWFDGTASQRIENNLEVQTKVCSIQCLVGSSRILLADGSWSLLETLKPGMAVASYNELTGRLESDRVSGIRSCGEDETLRIVTTHGVLECNADHPLLVQGFEGNVWMAAGKIKPGMLTAMADSPEKSKYLSEVIRIEPAARREVWDLSIEKNPSYVAEQYIVHNTRWHIDDLNGRLIAQERAGGSMRWKYCILPAIADREDVYDGEKLLMRKGDALCPEILSVEQCELIRRTKSRYWWEALYQQRPATQDGILWATDCFPHDHWVDRWPSRVKYLVIGIDPATGRALRDGDYSAIVALGIGHDGKLYCQADMDKTGPLETTQRLASFCRTLPMAPDIIAIESNGFQFLMRAMAEETFANTDVSGRIEAYDTNERDVPLHKEDRIAELDPLIVSKDLHWVRGPGTELLVSQLQNFPSQDHDDGPDALELASWVLSNLN